MVMPIDLEENSMIEGARIKVIGVGGGGNNAVDRMIEAGVTKAEFICVNTDLQQLRMVKAPTVLQIGAKLTGGLGAGAKPEVGRQAAEETKDEIKNLFKDTDMVFVTAGMGGGTGTGAAPIIAEAAKSLGILTVAVVTKPFFFEGPQRMKNAEEGIASLKDKVDAIVTIPNDLLLKIADKKVTLKDSFKLADDVLRQGVQGIIEVITQEGIMNCDFADVRTIMKDSGVAHMGIGYGKGENAAQDAVHAAIESPLLETNITGASSVLLNITGGSEFSLVDVNEVSGIVREMVSQDANIIIGTAVDDSLKDDIKVTLIATGLEGEKKPQQEPDRYARFSGSSASSGSSSVSSAPRRNTEIGGSDDLFTRRLRPRMSSSSDNFFNR
ncbi:MAG: cell division protein FtsZ [bacterium]|nr:cell division protein FtsZ [bacterium]